MSDSNASNIAYGLSRAKESLDEAYLLFDNNHFNTAVNRLYYSCFYAASALLLASKIDAKTHSGVKQMFGLHFVVPGIVPKELGTLFTELFEMRQEADYEYLLDYDSNDVSGLLEPTRIFVQTLKNILPK